MWYATLTQIYDESVLSRQKNQFFQLKTIEQNEMALIAESNNQAILVFTIVTVVFLPLSFFTSYFGMNLKGIADTERNERYFWTVCGSTTVSIVILTLLFGFRRQIYDIIWTNRPYSRPSNNTLSNSRAHNV